MHNFYRWRPKSNCLLKDGERRESANPLPLIHIDDTPAGYWYASRTLWRGAEGLDGIGVPT